MTEPSVLVVGETLIDFIPDSAGPLAEVETFGRRAGGAPANVAVGLARLDDTPWPCTTLSTDPFGEFLAARVEDEGISDQFITRVDNSTALAFVSRRTRPRAGTDSDGIPTGGRSLLVGERRPLRDRRLPHPF